MGRPRWDFRPDFRPFASRQAAACPPCRCWSPESEQAHWFVRYWTGVLLTGESAVIRAATVVIKDGVGCDSPKMSRGVRGRVGVSQDRRTGDGR